ncbi:MAG TPA: hypothetical protein VG013_23230, partial [Gemmataceae bacterium]|nr:hypothetical protein [Gemmataceae bacterium]
MRSIGLLLALSLVPVAALAVPAWHDARGPAGRPVCAEVTVRAVKPLLRWPKLARIDLHGDTLPRGALVRMGTVRFRHDARITCVAFSPDGKMLDAGDFWSTVRVWQVATGKQLRAFRVHQCPIRCVAFSADGGALTAVDDGLASARRWEIATGKQIAG